MNVTIAGNFGLSEGSMQPHFQHTGTWYDYFSGKAFEITSTSGNITLAPGEFRIYVNKPVAFPEPGLVNSTINCVTASATAGLITCHGGTTTLNITGTGGFTPYTGTGSYTVGAGTYNYRIVDAGGCISNISGVLTQPAALAVTASTNNSELYFGFPGDEKATIRAVPAGGTAPYKVEITMNRSMHCNYLNEAGDESWTATGGKTVNNSCPSSPGMATGIPVSTITGLTAGEAYSLDVTLLEDAYFTITVTDAVGCSIVNMVQIEADDIRCIAGQSGAAKVAIYHKTGNTKNPCIKICVNPSDVQEHLNHGDYMSDCMTNGVTPPVSMTSAARAGIAGLEEPATTELQIRLMNNNPSQPNVPFRLHILSNNTSDLMSLRVLDATGKLIENRQYIRSGQTIEIGATYRKGVYLVEARQGQQHKVIKLIKQ